MKVLCKLCEVPFEVLKYGLWEKQWKKWKSAQVSRGKILWKVLWKLWTTCAVREKQRDYENCMKLRMGRLGYLN